MQICNNSKPTKSYWLYMFPSSIFLIASFSSDSGTGGHMWDKLCKVQPPFCPWKYFQFCTTLAAYSAFYYGNTWEYKTSFGSTFASTGEVHSEESWTRTLIGFWTSSGSLMSIHYLEHDDEDHTFPGVWLFQPENTIAFSVNVFLQ